MKYPEERGEYNSEIVVIKKYIWFKNYLIIYAQRIRYICHIILFTICYDKWISILLEPWFQNIAKWASISVRDKKKEKEKKKLQNLNQLTKDESNWLVSMSFFFSFCYYSANQCPIGYWFWLLNQIKNQCKNQKEPKNYTLSFLCSPLIISKCPIKMTWFVVCPMQQEWGL